MEHGDAWSRLESSALRQLDAGNVAEAKKIVQTLEAKFGAASTRVKLLRSMALVRGIVNGSGCARFVCLRSSCCRPLGLSYYLH
jgi:hypothetical protein